MEARVRRKAPEESESYFVSMTDLMVGLVLIFIILLAYFALNLQATEEKLTGADAARADILQDLSEALKKEGLAVSIDIETGVLRLPDELLFNSGQYQLTEKGQRAVGTVADAMSEILPCYTIGAECAGEQSPYRVDAIFVEGHTDQDPMTGGLDNYDLSVMRAANTFRALKAANPIVDQMRNLPKSEPASAKILGLSGYGPDRLVDEGESPEAKSRNRRIDLRFLMMSPGALEEDALLK
ncbi:OmpA family protein [Novosphingobium sp. YJ-S2-02]|uniref:OmpA family protein n=1 Tax=Novosphingobium aureum TaxID=2792964 RepID=A0A931HFC8_9SPHN|nr:OmpA family protein [Novosphingobium aureum]MBH0114373.1 OmpA family protein [Novosphingobium aureum]